jgi:hypothetical protein
VNPSDYCFELVEVVPGLAETLLAEGWAPGPPPDLRAESLAADLEAAAEMACEHCGTAGLAFAAFPKGRKYRVVATCPECGTEVELEQPAVPGSSCGRSLPGGGGRPGCFVVAFARPVGDTPYGSTTAIL